MSYKILLLFCFATTALCQVTLEGYNIDASSVTVSGISSGGAFATQYHVIHSNDVKGVATFAGVVYHCANGLATNALLCMDSPIFTSVTDLIDKTINLAGRGDVDPTSGMSGDNVYVFAGALDTVVVPENGNQIVEYYTYFGSSIQSEFSIQAEHCQPTDSHGPACSYLGGEFINDCSFNGAYEALNYLYDNSLTRPDASVVPGALIEFSQKEFYPFSSPVTYSADSSGYLYVPSGCADKTQTCRLHVAFHGCLQGKEYLDNIFATETEYIETAEVNNIIVLFPQVVHTILTNPNGCWDWWGYTGITTYATKDGPQIKATEEMITRLITGA